MSKEIRNVKSVASFEELSETIATAVAREVKASGFQTSEVVKFVDTVVSQLPEKATLCGIGGSNCKEADLLDLAMDDAALADFSKTVATSVRNKLQ